MDAYLGVGISAGRWAGVLLGDRRDVAIVADDIASLVVGAAAVERPRAIAIDIPIGPPVKGLRACDAAARAVLKDRGSLLLSTPSLAALEVARRYQFEAAGFPEAQEVNLEQQGIGLSRQTYGLARMILDVHDWLAAGGSSGVDVVECHPEVCFAHMASPRDPAPPKHGKTSWEGMRHRIQMLKGAGIDVQYLRDDTGLIGAEDLVDAAVCAWTARRFWAGNAARYPAQPVDGDTAAIWA